MSFTIKPAEDGFRFWFTGGNLQVGGSQKTGEHTQVLEENPPLGASIAVGRGNNINTHYYYSIAALDNVRVVPETESIWITRVDNSRASVFQMNNDTAKNLDHTPVLDANGGAFAGGVSLRSPLIAPEGLAEWTAKNTPTRSGYSFKGWASDQAGQLPWNIATLDVRNGTYLYAQWEKQAGKPQQVDLDCSTNNRCELTVNYADDTAKTREFQPGNGTLAWNDAAVDGVLLDASGYAADGACSDTRCWYVSLKDKPDVSQTVSLNQTPTTGAPSSDLTLPAVVLAVGAVGVSLVLTRRRRA